MGDRLRGGEWFDLRRRVLRRDNHQCRNCGISSNLCVHHIVPVSEGGNETLSNLATLCRECHRRAHAERIRTDCDPTKSSTKPVFTVEEVSVLCRTTLHPLHRAVLTTLAKTGIGVGELCNLDIDDVELGCLSDRGWNPTDQSFLRIRYGGEIPYNNRRERATTTYVPADSELVHALKRWLLVRPDTRKPEPLFCSVSEWGKRITPSMVRSLLEQYDAGERIERLTPLEFRHFFEERFDGPPPVRGYILRGGDVKRSHKELYTAYRDSIYALYRGVPLETLNPQGLTFEETLSEGYYKKQTTVPP